jgi:tRNA threonylcarbamoyladenosine biosynthesis protein TsaB
VVILALDTSTRRGSLALWRADLLVDVRVGDSSRTHAERLPGDLIDMLAAHGARLTDVDLIAVVAGPGGFTGLRVGLASVQGLALTTGRPALAVSGLLLLALTARDRADVAAEPFVGAWMNATRGEVFTALYRVGPRPAQDGAGAAGASENTPSAAIAMREGLIAIDGPTVAPPEATASRWAAFTAGHVVWLAGDAPAELSEPARSRLGANILTPPPLAGVLAAIAARHHDLGRAPHAIVPEYVRRPDAELARDRDRGVGAVDPSVESLRS